MSFSTQDIKFIRSQTLRAISSNRAPGLHFAGYFFNITAPRFVFVHQVVGEYAKTFPSGNGQPGGDFLAKLPIVIPKTKVPKGPKTTKR